ncbi:response regulator transcription factor [Rhizobium laguerreae]|uniref:FixJ family two-component response regulator n=1 Tax=Rhizobium laguerreae TaxID=1076926 RepID=A0A1S9H2X4_9HYPH|nr:response regulator transcription factor [Rhizobium laguerreae]MBB3166755.1 FixJ family two-component response regulator [Rhizobium laguerreae]MBY3075573.1 response regulator transcription factor [Rhizobium laguerreae]MBY3088961.1 response regulator transcription factor [Rhizobium laguerreae]MBY3093480.1 response regulator transcription factor [Rhizobium laguerreae]MBY3102922.1 response regulator transcription factor [Rhizobium laguerreae]
MVKIAPTSSQPTSDVEPAVYVIDDDAGVRDSLGLLFRSVGLRAELFRSANEFLQRKLPPNPSCLVLDVRLPGLSGFELHAELTRVNIQIPIIFITAHGDIPMSVRAMKAGAVDFITKPFRDQDMLDAVTAAITRDRTRLDAERARFDLQGLFTSLTSREQEVMALVATGLMNKQIAAHVGLSEITVKIHRGHAMKKMHAKSLADLVKMAEALGI